MAARKFRLTWPNRRTQAEPTHVDANAEVTGDNRQSAFASGDGDIRQVSGQNGPDYEHTADPTWLGELESPYGLSDEDGTLKQLDSVNWRGGPHVKRRRTKGFIPQKGRQSPVTGGTAGVGTGTGRWQSGRMADGMYGGSSQGAVPDGTRSLGGYPRTHPPGASPQAVAMPSKGSTPTRSVSAGSTWLLQLGAAVVLTLVAVYAHDGSTPLAIDARGAYQRVFATDYTKTAVPTVINFLKAHHIAVPTFLSQAGALQLHTPLTGSIVQDYSATHPQMVIAGAAGAPVLAAGSGTVTRVVSLQNGFMIVIDHGTIGSSYYFGLASASVRVGESVESGEVIGKLPSKPSPHLMFEIEQGGKAVNPHDYIVFQGSTGGA
jgi:murein DD-endopeptidase MepM/ murein hydrolase activator NlpD